MFSNLHGQGLMVKYCSIGFGFSPSALKSLYMFENQGFYPSDQTSIAEWRFNDLDLRSVRVEPSRYKMHCSILGAPSVVHIRSVFVSPWCSFEAIEMEFRRSYHHARHKEHDLPTPQL